MQIKSYSARTGKEVLAMIKEELGPDAVILDSKEEDGVITMTAATERDPLPVQRPAPSAKGDAAPPASAATVQSDQRTLPGFEPIGGRTTRFQAPSATPERKEPAGPPKPVSPAAATDAPLAPPDVETMPRPPKVHDAATEAFRMAQVKTRTTRIPPPVAEQGEEPASPRQAQPRQPSSQSPRPQAPLLPGVSASPAASPAQGGQVPQGWQQWHEEWSTIKNYILALVKPAMRLDLLPPRQRLALEFLQREGVEDDAVLHLYQRLQNDPESSILEPLSQLVPVRTWDTENWPQRIQVIAGPFGTGKTSVAIRLALTLRKDEPNFRICLVNADATRGNGRLLLRHYCELSDLAYKEASTTLELVAALNAALREGFERVIVDLPGLSRGRSLATLLADAGLGDRTGEGADDIAVHLTLAPHYGSLQLGGILQRYRTPHAGSIVWTKLDEAEHYGQLVNVAVESGLPVAALSFGPGLRNSLAPASENMLWRMLFKRELPIGS